MTPPVVLVHGWGGSFASTWQRSGFTELLRDAGREVIGVDLLGHGTAPKPHEPEAYGDLGARVLEAMPDEPVDAVGFSLGAITLLRLAMDHPKRFQRLVLAGIGRNVLEPDPDSARRIVAALDGTAPETDTHALLFSQYANQPGNDPVALGAIMRRTSRAVPTADELAAVTCRTLVVIGDKDFAGPGDPLVAALPNATLTVLRNTDHFATPESFGFIDATLEFLDAIPRMSEPAGPQVGTSVDEALAVLRRGGLVAIPTETVYGLAADASNPAAVRRIFVAKGRPADHPLIVHVGRPEQLAAWAATVPPAAGVLADACWPGPLTLLVPRAAHVLDVVTGGRDTVGIRVPAHPLTEDLLLRFGGGLAAPSANRFGQVSPTTAAHVVADLGDAVDYVLDGGACPVGVESTIVDCSVEPPQILRPGGIPTEQIDALLGGALAPASGPSRAAGMLAAHYAPRARVLLAASAQEAAALATEVGPTAWVLDRTGDLVAYARHLYADLRGADERGVVTVVAVLPLAEGLGHAIRDRLAKAAASSTPGSAFT